MTSVFKQAATQSRNQYYIQFLKDSGPPQWKQFRPRLEPRFGRNKFESKPFSRIMISFARDIASKTNSFLELHLHLVSFTSTLIQIK
jgi:hypothetical protein